MIRFFVSRADIYEGMTPDGPVGTIRLSAADTTHIRSLRLRPTELFTVCDGEGTDYICRLANGGETGSAHNGASTAEIIETRPSRGEPSVACTVYIALAKGDRLDYAVQKSVELGACGLVVFPSVRCVPVPGDMTKKIARLNKIALETAKQSGRGRVPKVAAAGSFKEAVEGAARAELPLFFYECEEKRSLKQALELCISRAGKTPGSVSIMTGPEGGFEPHEAEFAQSAGLLAVTLGPRILRCETAPAAALAALMFYFDEM
jgi:16S rRNA (uracil1498-N3)-methyltransferase